MRNKWKVSGERWKCGGWYFVCLLLMLLSCTPKDQKLQQYFIKGEELYSKHCSNCHQADGSGLGLVYPSLNKSDYIDKNLEGVICLMEYGKRGEIIVNGKSFNKSMPGIPSLTDLEIAEIATYLYNNWDREKGVVEEKEVIEALKKCKSK